MTILIVGKFHFLVGYPFKVAVFQVIGYINAYDKISNLISMLSTYDIYTIEIFLAGATCNSIIKFFSVIDLSTSIFLAEYEPADKTKKEPQETEDVSMASENKDVEMEDISNHCRAEGCIRFEVKSVSKIKDTALSDPVIIRNLPW